LAHRARFTRPLLLAAFAAGLSCVAGMAFAADETPDPNLGRNLAASCAMCHGTDGRSAGITPSLAGRPAREIVETVRLFRAGTKPATIMGQIARGYTDAQVEAIAGYFAAQAAGK
jgi:cytochrome subunit of sulfide dehydrogenase